MELFMQACGARGLMLEVVHEGRQTTARHSLYQPFALIGREPRADICLLDPDVHKRHAYIQCLAGRILHIDVQGRDDSETPESKLTRWLPKRDSFQVAGYAIRVANGKPTDKSTLPTLHNGGFDKYLESLPKVALRISEGGGQSLSGTMSGVVALLGRSTGGALGLVSRTVSRVHCILVRTPSGVWVVDLLGRGGTWVNGAPVRYARLETGDQLCVGKFLIELDYEDKFSPRNKGDKSWKERSTQSAPAWPFADSSEDARSLPVLAPIAKPPAVPANLLISQEQLLEVLTPFANQFRLMQEHMFEQFQQSLLTMFDMFNTVQREQTSALRQELDELKKVNQEIRELREEMTRRSMPIPQPISLVPLDRLSPIVVATMSFDTRRPHPEEPSMASTQRPSDPQHIPNPAANASQAPVPGRENSQQELSVPPERRPGSDGATAGPPNGSANATSRSEPTPPAGVSIHDWLSQRMNQLQHEQQSRWQRLVQILTGK
jgi:pSer/pThr/pTyr-binding forkhead associated (FHA) protein